MVRLRIALGVASSLVAIAALSIVLTGTGEAQGNGNGLPTGPNVVVVNTPLPVTGDVTATISGNVSATILNPADNPVLVRDVDAQGPKELWQMNKSLLIPVGDSDETLSFDPIPAGKALIIEQVHCQFHDSNPAAQGPALLSIIASSKFNGQSSTTDVQQFIPQQIAGTFANVGSIFVAQGATKFYLRPNAMLFANVVRSGDVSGTLRVILLATGYLVDYP